MVLPIAIIMIMMTRLRRSCPVCPTWCWSGTGESSSAASSPSSSRSSFHCYCSSVLDHFWTNLIYVLGQYVAGQNVPWPVDNGDSEVDNGDDDKAFSTFLCIALYWRAFICAKDEHCNWCGYIVQQISLRKFIGWEIEVYFQKLFVPFLTNWPS